MLTSDLLSLHIIAFFSSSFHTTYLQFHKLHDSKALDTDTNFFKSLSF